MNIEALLKLGVNEKAACQLLNKKPIQIDALKGLLERAKNENDLDAADALRWALFQLL